MSDLDDDDPTAWLGDSVGMDVTGAGDVVISVPPDEPGAVVITLVRAPTINDPNTWAPDAFVRVNLDGAQPPAGARGSNRAAQGAL
jgi:hypothetical protein